MKFDDLLDEGLEAGRGDGRLSLPLNGWGGGGGRGVGSVNQSTHNCVVCGSMLSGWVLCMGTFLIVKSHNDVIELTCSCSCSVWEK